MDGLGSIARVVRAEGFSAVRDRLWDRARDAVTRARCASGGSSPWPAAPILNAIGVPMTTMFGGVPLQLRARLRRESMLRPVALLSREPRAQSAGWRLEAWSEGHPRRAMTFPAGPWDGDALADDPAFVHAVHTCVSLVNARAIHIENAAGLSLVSLSALMGIGQLAMPGASTDGPPLPVVLSVHDLSLISRDPHGQQEPTAPLPKRLSLGEGLTFSRRPRGTQSASWAPEAPGTAEAAGAAPAPTLLTPRSSRDRYVADRAATHEAAVADRQRFEHAFHHALGTGIMRAAAFTIYPSQFMRHRIEALPHLPAHVVAPGIEPPARTLRSARRPNQIALLGGGQAHKGGPRLARIASALAARGMHVTSYGGYGHEYLLQMRGIRGVRVRGYYRAGSLPELLARQSASVAVILSAVPESFSLVLSEAWAAGVPVIAPATGAFAERLRAPDAPDAPNAANAAATLAAPLAAPTAAMPRATNARSGSGPSPADKDGVRAGGLLISSEATDEEILDAAARAVATSFDALPTPPTAAQAAERHLALYRTAGFIAEPVS